MNSNLHSYYIFSLTINTILTFLLSVFILNKRVKREYLTFVLSSFSVSFWSFFFLLSLISKDIILTKFFFRTCMIGVLFIPAPFTHFTVLLTRKKINKLLLIANYLIPLVISPFVFSNWYAIDDYGFLGFNYWPYPSILLHLAFIHFIINVLFSQYLLWTTLNKSSGFHRTQILYVTVGTLIGYLSGATNYTVWYRIPIPPIFNILVSSYVIFTYLAITKTHLMDLSLIVSKSITYLITTLIFTLAFIVITIPFNMFSHSINLPFIILTLAFVIFSSYYFEKLRLFIQTSSDKVFLKGKYEFKSALCYYYV